MGEDSAFVECSEAESSGLDSLLAIEDSMRASAEQGSQTFGKASALGDFVDAFTKLALGSSDQISEDGISFADLNSFVSRSSSDAQVVQRIADKALNEKRAQQAAEEEAARKAAEE